MKLAFPLNMCLTFPIFHDGPPCPLGLSSMEDRLSNLRLKRQSLFNSHRQSRWIISDLDHKVETNTIFFRSRKSVANQKFSPSNMGKPPADKTKNGRANPVGIPYLYLASDLNTAISEIRPSINDKITVGKFKLTEPISIIDLINVSPFPFLEDEDFEILINKIGYLKKLGADLSKPINPKDEELEYLPTQYLCEFIKNCGWEGVAYNSSLASGYNLAIFIDGKTNCTETDLYLIGKTTLSYELCS